MLQRLVVCVIIMMMTCFNSVQSLSLDVDNEIFPVPENLKPNVDFWIKIFSMYNSDQIVIHDAENLSIIYEVVDGNELPSGNLGSYKGMWREAERIKDTYQSILTKFSIQLPTDPESLNDSERKVYNLFQSEVSSERFQRAAQNIRGQQGLRDRFRKGLITSGRYLNHIKQIFERYNIPEQLISLPHVESSFNLRAYSKFGAAGIWQFTRSTGRRFLRIDYLVDERFDPYLSTEAAAKLLRENYETLGVWPLAITAYNHGVNGMQRAVAQLGTTDIGEIVKKYQSRNFKFASGNFYAEFLAAVEVRKNYKIYFGDIEFEAPEQHIIFEVPNNVKISTLARELNTSIKELESLNPALRKSVLSSNRSLPKGYALRIPWREDFDARLASAQMPANDKLEVVATEWYQIEAGDNLASIARRFNTTIDTIMDLNDIENPHQIYVGKILKLKPEKVAAAETTPAVSSESRIAEKPPVIAENILKPDKQKIPPAVSEKANRPAPGVEIKTPAVDTTKPEFKFQGIPSESRTITVAPGMSGPEKGAARDLKPAYGYIYVQPEETLGHYADWLSVPTQELRGLNGFNYGTDIILGQKIKLVFRQIAEKEFQRKRIEYHRGIEEDFFASFKIDSVLVHKIKHGENIWYLCNQVYEIPYWLVLKYNPNKNLEQLNTSDELIIPIIERTDNNTAS